MRKKRNGEGCITQEGYVYHKFGTDGGGAFAHVIKAENALGKKLPTGVVVHHADGNKSNNDGNNLVICPSQK